MTTATDTTRVTVFADRVRAALADLPADAIDDLTDGLEADLLDQAADDDAFLAGDPADYAAELRAAAGLDPAARRRPGLGDIPANVRTNLAQLREWWEGDPQRAKVLDFLRAMAPLWWVARAWAVYQFCSGMLGVPFAGLPTHGAGWLVLLGLLATSVMWGRGRWLPNRVVRGLRTLVNVFAVVAVPILVLIAATSPTYAQSSPDYYDTPPTQGLALDGTQVSNIYAYDSNGEPIDGVQLFTQYGTPLVLGTPEAGQAWLYRADDATGNSWAAVPDSRTSGTDGWNVYPLTRVALDDETGMPVEPRTELPDARPFDRVQPLVPVVAETPAPIGPTAAPNAGSDTPAPTPTPTPTR